MWMWCVVGEGGYSSTKDDCDQSPSVSRSRTCALDYIIASFIAEEIALPSANGCRKPLTRASSSPCAERSATVGNHYTPTFRK